MALTRRCHESQMPITHSWRLSGYLHGAKISRPLATSQELLIQNVRFRTTG
jgi:hypothetical protein